MTTTLAAAPTADEVVRALRAMPHGELIGMARALRAVSTIPRRALTRRLLVVQAETCEAIVAGTPIDELANAYAYLAALLTTDLAIVAAAELDAVAAESNSQ